PARVECHTSYTDAGATANDTCAGDLTSGISASSTVVVNTPGSYSVTYAVSDPSGNTQTATRTVNVVDTTPPVIALLGANPQTIECHTPYVEAGATAADTCAGDLTSQMIIDRTTVEQTMVGSYTVTYGVSDH